MVQTVSVLIRNNVVINYSLSEGPAPWTTIASDEPINWFSKDITPYICERQIDYSITESRS